MSYFRAFLVAGSDSELVMIDDCLKQQEQDFEEVDVMGEKQSWQACCQMLL